MNTKNLYNEHIDAKKEIKDNLTNEESLKTKESKKIDDNDSEILKGKSLEKVKQVKESFNSLERKLLDKLM